MRTTCKGTYTCTDPTVHCDYRPPIQDGPSTSSHNTEVPSFARVAVFECNAPICSALAALSNNNRVEVGLVLMLILKEPINGSYYAGLWM